jgi:hypothetical protein
MLDAQQASLPRWTSWWTTSSCAGAPGRLEVEAQNRAVDGGQREWRLASST